MNSTDKIFCKLQGMLASQRREKKTPFKRNFALQKKIMRRFITATERTLKMLCTLRFQVLLVQIGHVLCETCYLVLA